MRRNGIVSFTSSFAVLFAMHKLWGIRVEAEVESRFGPQLDMDGLIAGLRRDPGRLIRV